MIHGYMVPRNNIAFLAQPSEAGAAFLRAYVGDASQMLLYEDSCTSSM